MEMGSKSSLPDEDLLCCVCFDVFTDPVLLSCTHSVCRTCLQGFWESKGSRECPVCRRRSSKEDPTLNRALKNLCDAFQERKNRGGSAGGSEVVCSLHREKLGFFCLDDQKPVCAVCQTSVRHTNHKFLSAEEAVAELKNKLQTALETLQKNQNVFQEAKRAYQQTAAHIKTQVQLTETQIKEEFEKLQQFLRAEEEVRIAALKKEEMLKSQMMKRKINEMEGRISSLSQTIKNIEKLMKAEDFQILQDFSSTEKLIKNSPVTPVKTPGALIDVAKHLSNLTYTVWLKMQKNVQYTPVTLDPNTAALHLRLSEDLTAAEYRHQNPAVPDNPERFDKYLCVLGSEGFSSGTHCWDVQVGDGHDWELGLISEQVSRKGQDFMSSVWTLGFNINSSKYWRRCPGEPVHCFSFGEKLQKIRVQLDWNRGKLTFINLLNNTHLYTITHTFTERVLPYFCTGSDHPLKILPVSVSVKIRTHT
ncbi:E3 ubiquitin-protein ligase TRIM35-like [Astyanax mexicanus]|uniref:E3 ubiquitin-protein ligase TRIM35-like n=1 Tax=Astyanax mexicanus TaxID=7994 RepID=UPI0020CB023B|nr:E3 ubiquitin-protein ligase TRIM35-like [Astyanax mexicanus]